MHYTERFVPQSIASLIKIGLKFEKIFGVFLLVLFTEAFIPVYSNAGYGWIRRLEFYLWKLNIFIVLVIMILQWRRSLRIMLQAKPLLIFLGFLWLSGVWSRFSYETRYQAIRIAETSLFGIYFVSRYKFKELTHMITFVFGLEALLSLLYVFAIPSIGITPSGPNSGLWRGLFIHKNTLGRIMVIAGIFLTANIFTNPKNRWLSLGGLIFAIYLILGSESKSALVSLFFLLAIAPFNRLFRWNIVIAIPLYLIVLLSSTVGAIFLDDNWDAALASIDKDPNLNGRIPLWNIVIERIQEHPWIGYGFHGFYQRWASPEHASILRTIVWKPDHGHNGFLDLVLELGVIGAFLFAIIFAIAFLRAINWIRVKPGIEGIWPIGFLTYFVLMNQTQTVLLTGYSIYWLLFTIIIVMPIEWPHKFNQSHPIQQIPEQRPEAYLRSKS